MKHILPVRNNEQKTKAQNIKILLSAYSAYSANQEDQLYYPLSNGRYFFSTLCSITNLRAAAAKGPVCDPYCKRKGCPTTEMSGMIFGLKCHRSCCEDKQYVTAVCLSLCYHLSSLLSWNIGVICETICENNVCSHVK